MSKKVSPRTDVKIALVHDYLREYGGAERVLEALHELFPAAPVYVGFIDAKALGVHWQRFANWPLHQTWLSRLPFIKQLYSPLRVLAPQAFADLDLSQFEVVISSSNAYFAKAVRVPNGTHICYCHTPPRALYGYTTRSNWKENPLFRVVGELLNHYLRIVDFKIAQKVDYFIANSQETKRRIAKFYRRSSTVINPPIHIPERTQLKPLKQRDYFLYVNRLALAKHPELAVAVCTQHQLPLKLVGTGPMQADLRNQAGLPAQAGLTAPESPSIEFLGAVSDDELQHLYAGAKALLYPVEDEDFGMIPVEAMAYGTPVIAHRSGGPLETVVENKTGLFFDDLTADGLLAAIKTYQKKISAFSAQTIARQAQKYSYNAFFLAISQFIDSLPAR